MRQADLFYRLRSRGGFKFTPRNLWVLKLLSDSDVVEAANRAIGRRIGT